MIHGNQLTCCGTMNHAVNFGFCDECGQRKPTAVHLEKTTSARWNKQFFEKNNSNPPNWKSLYLRIYQAPIQRSLDR